MPEDLTSGFHTRFPQVRMCMGENTQIFCNSQIVRGKKGKGNCWKIKSKSSSTAIMRLRFKSTSETNKN